MIYISAYYLSDNRSIRALLVSALSLTRTLSLYVYGEKLEKNDVKLQLSEASVALDFWHFVLDNTKIFCIV